MEPKSTAPKLQPGSSIPIPKSKRGIKGFWRDLVRESKHVTWPSRQEAARLTGVVLGVCLIVILYLFLLSSAFDVLFRIVFRGGG